MGIIDKLKSLLASDDQLMGRIASSSSSQAHFAVPASITTDSVYQALVAYGMVDGYISSNKQQASNDLLLASVKNQVIKMHEEILGYYHKKNLSPDEKLLNRLTIENMFYLSMGTAILAKVKKTNLIAQGFFGKLLKKSGPEFFYREVAAMAGHKYGSPESERLHQHLQRAIYQLLTSFDDQPNAKTLVIECAKATYMYGLAVTIRHQEPEAINE